MYTKINRGNGEASGLRYVRKIFDIFEAGKDQKKKLETGIKLGVTGDFWDLAGVSRRIGLDGQTKHFKLARGQGSDKK